ncbi:MAG: alginate export family protein [Verrucomicrobiales bacterium]
MKRRSFSGFSRPLTLTVTALACLTASALQAPNLMGGELTDASALGKAPVLEIPEKKAEPWIRPTADIRARYEYGDQADRNASNAETLRGRIGLLTKEYHGFQFFAEYDGTIAADTSTYQAASVDGLGQNLTIIADPESSRLGQAWGSYSALDSIIKVGRQKIVHDDHRYIGNVGWRQTQQTYDAIDLGLGLVEQLPVSYTIVNGVNRIFGSQTKANPAQNDFDGVSHFVRTTYDGLPFGKLTLLAYMLDLGNEAGDTKSNKSFGAFLKGPLPFYDLVSYHLEYGYQSDAFDNSNDYTAHYVRGMLDAAVGEKHTLGLGYERLGSDNGVGYQFPLSTLHKFNGLADVFLTTPPDGLQDIYVSGGTKLPWDLGGKLVYHKFYNAGASVDYGNEINFLISKNLGRGFSAIGMYAYYWAGDDRYVDTNRFTLEVNYKF